MHVIDLIVKTDDQEPAAAEILVQAAVDGRMRDFLVDTGAARSCLVLDEHSAGYQVIGSEQSSGVFSMNMHDVIELKSLSLGSETRSNFPIHRYRTKSKYDRNLLGMDFFINYRCLFSIDRSQLTLEAAAPFAQDAALNSLTVDGRDHPYVQVKLGQTYAQATWDTGAGVTVVDREFIHKHERYFQPAGISQGMDSTGKSRKTRMYMMSSAIIDRHEFPAHKVAEVDLSALNSRIELPMAMILGYTTLSQANWYFDFPGNRWAITNLL